MVYKFLVHKNSKHSLRVPFRQKWKLVPASWRPWWQDYFVGLPMDDEDPPLFVDLTEQLKEVTESIEELHWVRLAKCMDTHFVYPEIRCPFGCSEFLHKANFVPLKDFLWAYSNYELKCYQTPNGRHWTDNISPSYPSSCMILEKFKCSPAIAITLDGPMILCCRYHSESSKSAYLHVPESPTGTVYTPNSNSIAPISVRSRTNRNFKRNVFSDTFCTVRQVGGFGGIDSSYCTSSSIPRRSDKLSCARDALSIQGRPDIRAQLIDRCSNPLDTTFIPKEDVQRMLRFSELMYPDPDSLSETRTSTYVPSETAVKLQEMVYGEGSRTIKDFTDGSTNQYSLRYFTPPWPTHFVQVHPTDGHGRRFQKIISKDFGLWMFLCMTGTVTDLWEAIADSVEDNRQWQGHWLNFAANSLGLRGRRRTSKYFPIRKVEDIFSLPLEQILNSKERTADLFSQCKSVHVTYAALTQAEVASVDIKKKKVIICIDPVYTRAETNQIEDFELRLLLSAKQNDRRNAVVRGDRRMFVRHTGQQFWVQEGKSHPRRYNGATLHKHAWKEARIAIFCRKELAGAAESLKRRYINAIGGQKNVYCGLHRCPLVLNHLRKNNTNCITNGCCMQVDSEQATATSRTGIGMVGQCSRFGTYVCPDSSRCRIAICEAHLCMAREECRRAGPETIAYLSLEDLTYAEHQDECDQAFRGATPEEMQGLPPEALGPTASHELPQDVIDLFGRDEGIGDDNSSVDTLDREDTSVFSEQPIEDWRSESTAEDMTQEDHRRQGFVHTQDDEEIAFTDDNVSAGGSSVQSAVDNDIGNTYKGDLTDHFNTGELPTTTTGTEQREIVVEHYDSEGFNIPLYVLLNQHGHLLTRTNHKLRMNKLHRSICERLVSKSSSKVIPLVYAEGQLFPTIFWHSLADGSIPGAVPTAMWADKQTLGKLGIASMREHARMRISNPALPTSTDTRYHFMLLDQLTNLGACGKHTRLVLQRGFADHQDKDGVSFRDKSDSAELYGETSENHANVHKLSALVHERRPHFFFTQTCNQKTCRGLRVLREWVTSTEALLLLREKYGLDFNEASYYLRESAASFVSRSWNEVADMWMRYIIYSDEMPLGEIDYAWYRKEFQDTEGNLAHIHSILRTRYNVDDPEGLKKVLHKIRGCITELVHHDDYRRMKEKGLVSSIDHLIGILAQAKSYLTHTCHTRCQIPRTTQDGETFFVCKVRENYHRTLTPHIHSIVPGKVSHMPEAKRIYTELGMMEGDHILEPCLLSEYHVPICSLEDNKFSPTNGWLFACFPSSQNLQYTTGRMLSDYLVKYVTKLDDVARVEMKPPGRYDSTNARGVVEQLHNTKITSNKIRAKETRKKNTNYGRLVTHTECLTVIQGENLVTSTVPFVHFSTAPREYRPALFKQSKRIPKEEVPDYISYVTNAGQEIRKQRKFQQYRLFSRDQMLVIFDERSSSLTVDAITVFSVRPPELRFVDSVPLFFRWFERKPMAYRHDTLRAELRRRLKKDLTKCHWIDGLHMHIILRRAAIDEIVQYAKSCDPSKFGAARTAKSNMLTLLLQIQRLVKQFVTEDDMDVDEDQPLRTRVATINSSKKQYEDLCEAFLSHQTGESTALPTPWTTPVFPKNRGRFLVYVLLLFGRFETEYGLMKQDSMKGAYVHAGLFDPSCPEESLKGLLRRYVRDCLSCQSGSIYHHDRNLILANAAFRECLLGVSDEFIIGTPCVLQSAMRQETTEKIKSGKRKLLSSFINALYSDLQQSGFALQVLPDKNRLENMHFGDAHSDNSQQQHTQIDYPCPPEYVSAGPQSLESYSEQKKILQGAINTIDRYIRGLSHKNIVICGGPGNGKTTVCEEICLYALSKGLRGIATSIVADRSKALGGMHIHLLCALPMSDRKNMTPGAAAEAALGNLYKRPELLQFWRELEFLYIDEFGAVSAELLATMDIVARKIKDSSKFLGGMLVVCSMDIHQLMPIDGTALMLSMNMMTEFSFTELKESVRAARDANLRRLCNLTRLAEWDDSSRAEFKSIITNNCKFVPSFDDARIPEDGIFVFGRKAPCQRIEDLLIEKMENSNPASLVKSQSQDEESSIAGNWRAASPPVTQELSRTLKAKRVLYLYEKGRYEFTYNLHGKFQQGQLAILLSINQKDVDSHRNIEFYKGPPGCKEFPPLCNFTKEYLEARGWEPVLVPYETSKPKKIWGRIVGRRTQYGVRLRIASTIHASQGATFGTLVTCVSNNTAFGDLNFALWEAAQVVVLLSRTRLCSDLYFVGDPTDVVEHLLSILQMKSRYMAHISSMTHRLCNRADNTTVDSVVLNGPPIFRPCDIILERKPAVYLLVSTRCYGYMYIGETKDIRKRLNDHNSGRGSLFTNNEYLRPWALFGYVHGFRSTDNRRNFEQFWKRVAMQPRNRSSTHSPIGVLQIAMNIATHKNRFRPHANQLRVHQCGTYDLRTGQNHSIMDET